MQSELEEFVQRRGNIKTFYNSFLDSTPYGHYLDRIATFDKFVVDCMENTVLIQDNKYVERLMGFLVGTSHDFHEKYNSFIEEFEDLVIDWLNDGGHFSKNSDEEEEPEDIRTILDENDWVENFDYNNELSREFDFTNFYFLVLEALEIDSPDDVDIMNDEDHDHIHTVIDTLPEVFPGYREFWHVFVDTIQIQVPMRNVSRYWSSFQKEEYKEMIDTLKHAREKWETT